MLNITQDNRKSPTSFLGILRTPQGSVILVAVENMPISPRNALGVVTDADYGGSAELEDTEAGVEQSIYIGQEFDSPTSLSYLNARYYESK